MELKTLCIISEKYSMNRDMYDQDERTLRQKTASEQRLTYSRSIRQSRLQQKSRSRSMPAILILQPPENLSPVVPMRNVSFDVPYNPDAEEIDSVPVRQFRTTYKGLINNGDLRKDSRRDSGVSGTSYRRDSSASVASSCHYSRCDSVFSDTSSRRNSGVGATNYPALPYRRSSVMSEPEYCKLIHKNYFSLSGSRDSVVEETPTQYQVVVLGGDGVGKSAIINQFTTSEFLGTADLCTGKKYNVTPSTNGFFLLVWYNKLGMVHSMLFPNKIVFFSKIMFCLSQQCRP